MPTTRGYRPGQWAATNGAMRAACLPQNSSSDWLRSVGEIPVDVAVHLLDGRPHIFQRRLLVHAVNQAATTMRRAVSLAAPHAKWRPRWNSSRRNRGYREEGGYLISKQLQTKRPAPVRTASPIRGQCAVPEPADNRSLAAMRATCRPRPPARATLARSFPALCTPIALRPTRSGCCWPPYDDRAPVPPGSIGFPVSKRRDEHLATPGDGRRYDVDGGRNGRGIGMTLGRLLFRLGRRPCIICRES